MALVLPPPSHYPASPQHPHDWIEEIDDGTFEVEPYNVDVEIE